MDNLLGKIERYGFKCEAGSLENCTDWAKLKQDVQRLEAENADLKSKVGDVTYGRLQSRIMEVIAETSVLHGFVSVLSNKISDWYSECNAYCCADMQRQVAMCDQILESTSPQVKALLDVWAKAKDFYVAEAYDENCHCGNKPCPHCDLSESVRKAKEVGL